MCKYVAYIDKYLEGKSSTIILTKYNALIYGRASTSISTWSIAGP